MVEHELLDNRIFKNGGDMHSRTAQNKVDFLIKKESRRNCCNSPAARRVPKNADSICEQSNREAPGTQEIFSLNPNIKQEVLHAHSR